MTGRKLFRIGESQASFTGTATVRKLRESQRAAARPGLSTGNSEEKDLPVLYKLQMHDTF